MFAKLLVCHKNKNRTIGFGQVQYTSPGIYSWTVPEGVYELSAVAVGAGGGNRGGGAGGTYTYNGSLRGYGGGGVGILGKGATGGATTGAGRSGSGGTSNGSTGGGMFGGGGGLTAVGTTTGGHGAVRIIWGEGRYYPDTNTANM